MPALTIIRDDSEFDVELDCIVYDGAKQTSDSPAEPPELGDIVATDEDGTEYDLTDSETHRAIELILKGTHHQ